MTAARWQWISDHFGPMGWFTKTQKTKYENTSEFKEGHWVPVTNDEQVSFYSWVGRLAYQQS